ncbi:MAG TPA: AMP-binding protein, partial [Paracoccaceae bacterium]|nr:AMP-binding protein [Paracoccaceae bacterium]
TWYFNVPAGYDMLVEAMERDPVLRESFFRNLNMMMYAGAGMAQHTWERLGTMAEETLGRKVLLASGLGATETGPFAMMCTEEQERAGNVGIPARGVVLKLVPVEDKLEARLKSPSVTPGYWRNERLTAEAFDEEGFYRLGDALRFAVPGRPERGFFFDGRIAENFKLVTGTWVAVGALRAKLVNEFGGLLRDAVIAGEDREMLTAILFPNWAALRALVPEGEAADEAALIAHPTVRTRLAERLSAHVAQATGSASRVMRVILAREEPSLDRGEITDKGSINQRAVLRDRQDLVEALYAEGHPEVIVAPRPGLTNGPAQKRRPGAGKDAPGLPPGFRG